MSDINDNLHESSIISLDIVPVKKPLVAAVFVTWLPKRHFTRQHTVNKVHEDCRNNSHLLLYHLVNITEDQT